MVREENGFSCLTLLPACICSWASLYLGRMDGVPVAGQDAGSLQSCADAQEQVAGHQGMPWATLPVHPGLMSCQVLLQMQSYSWLKTGHTTEGCSGTEHCGTGGKPCRCHSSLALTFQTVLFPCNFSGGTDILWSCACFGCSRAGAGAKAGMPDTAEPAGSLSTAAAAVMVWVSHREMQLLKCLPSIPGRGWHPTKAAPPIQQPKGCSFLCEPETGSAKRAFRWHFRNPHYERGNLVLWKSFAVAVSKTLALTCNNF